MFVAHLRLGIAIFALCVLILDVHLSQFHKFVAISIGGGYFTAALLMGLLRRRRPVGSSVPIIFHGVDLGVAATFVFSGPGAFKLSLVLIAFCLLSAAIQWGLAGVAASFAVLLAASAPLGIVSMAAGLTKITPALLLDVLTYATPVSLMLGLVVLYRRHQQQRARQILAWPGGRDDGSVIDVLRHAQRVLGLESIVALWQETASQGWKVAAIGADGAIVTVQAPPPGATLVSGPLAQLPFMAIDPLTGQALTQEGPRAVPAPLIHPDILQLPPQRGLSCAPIDGDGISGHLFAVHPLPLSGKTLALIEIVAGQISADIGKRHAREELGREAAAQERARLGRDIHDTILQELTAARLQLAGIAAAAPKAASPAIEYAAGLLAGQQKRIREFVLRENPRPLRQEMLLQDAIAPILAELSALWRCKISSRCHPANAPLSAERLPQIRLILAEAVANAVRHGQATEVDVSIEVDAGLWMEVRDNGTKTEAVDDDEARLPLAPFSLKQRVRDMGGGCNLTITSQGGTLVVALPVA